MSNLLTPDERHSLDTAHDGGDALVLADVVRRLEAIVDGKFESLGFLPTTILGRLEMKLPSGKWLVLQDCSRLGLALESHSSHVDWIEAAKPAGPPQ